MHPRILRALLGAVAVAALLVPIAGRHTPAYAEAAVTGSGSTYVGLAMSHWRTEAQTRGLNVSYTSTGSPEGLTSFAQGLRDFAGTEAEYSALGVGASRSYQYVPDVAGAIAVMYNVDDQAGRKVDYLHLSMRTIARIFMGDITQWSDPAISADNKGLVLPDQPITVVYRAGQSGTTALFYDFVASVAPDVFAPWAARNRLPTDVRIIQLDSSPTFAPRTVALSGSDTIAQYVAGNNGKWAIAYDEFGYALTYNAPAAWVQNASGNWVLPFAENISAALESAQLRPDLSQELSGVYASPNPAAYPISAYSYLVTQCAPDGARPSCKGSYANDGVTETLARWMRYIACEGQVSMAEIGYSPLPPNLSQEMANSVGRMKGTTPEILTAENCANPRFRGSLGTGAGSPRDPLADVESLGSGGGAGSTGDGPAAAADSQAAVGPEATQAEEVRQAASRSRTSSGGSDVWRAPDPVAYTTPAPSGIGADPLVALVVAVGLPVLVGVAFGRSRRTGRARP